MDIYYHCSHGRRPLLDELKTNENFENVSRDVYTLWLYTLEEKRSSYDDERVTTKGSRRKRDDVRGRVGRELHLYMTIV